MKFARFGKVPLEVGSVDLDVGQIPARPATVIKDFHLIGLGKARWKNGEDVSGSHHSIVCGKSTHSLMMAQSL